MARDLPDDLADLLGPDPTDPGPLRASFFASATHTAPDERPVTYDAIAEIVRNAVAKPRDKDGRRCAPEALDYDATKKTLPLIGLYRLNGTRLKENETAITGVFADYDGGPGVEQGIRPEEAVRRLEAAGIEGLVYSSPGHEGPAGLPRWRAVALLSREAPPAAREDLVDRLNGALVAPLARLEDAERKRHEAAHPDVIIPPAHVAAPESWAPVQGMFAGRIPGQPEPLVLRSRGRPLDLVEGIEPAGPAPSARRPARDADAPPPPDDLTLEAKRGRDAESIREDLASGKLAAALRTAAGIGRQEYLDREWQTPILGLAFGTPDDLAAPVFALLMSEFVERSNRMARWAANGKVGHVRRQAAGIWGKARVRDVANPTTLASLYGLADGSGADWRPKGAAAAAAQAAQDLSESTGGDEGAVGPRFEVLTPADCATAPRRGYIIKGLLAPRDVGMIFGQPGAGKSLLAPWLAYQVALGDPVASPDSPAHPEPGELEGVGPTSRRVFGRRTKRTGPILYVAAEDPGGMRGRVKALHRRHGDAPDFLLVDGLTNLIPGSADLAALLDMIAERRPSLVVVDTVQMAFPAPPGVEAEREGHFALVVAAARALTRHGAAVLLIHHPPKAGDTPRGSGLLNGNLDVTIHIERDERGIVRVKDGMLPKNRNGAAQCDLAFRIEVEADGHDEDGDAIGLPVCSPLPQASSAFEELTPTERKALDALRACIASAGGDGVHCALEAWRAACIAPGVLSDADKPDSRAKAFGRAREGLAAKGRTLADNGLVRAISLNSNDLEDAGQAGH